MLHSLKQQNSNHKVVINYIGLNGESKEDNSTVLAKEVNTNGKSRYFCKFNTTGIEAGHLVNPWSMYANPGVTFDDITNKRTGKLIYEYKEVTASIFELYTRYLKSRSDVHYRQAERAALENV
jgi:hypothetical protein